jgi:hydrogenase nickel incorporation protein HypA/HybF
MHELSVASAILNTAVRHAEERPVAVVAVRIGTLRQVVPESLRFYWEIVARDTICEDATLAIEVLETRLHCGDCGRDWEPLIPAFRCPRCDSGEVTVTAGEQLEVDYLELKEPVNA